MRQLVIISCILLCTLHAFSQEQTKVISGTVTDIFGSPLIGATIQSFPSLNGSAADQDGNYEFNIPQTDTLVVVSYIGYITHEITLDQIAVNPSIDVALSDGILLTEVLVVGYSNQPHCILRCFGFSTFTKPKHYFAPNVHNVLNNKIAFSMYPNPASNFITIENTAEIDQIQIHSMDGKRVLFKQLGPNEKHQLDISALVNGSYIVQIISEGKIKAEKLEVMKDY